MIKVIDVLQITIKSVVYEIESYISTRAGRGVSAKIVDRIGPLYIARNFGAHSFGAQGRTEPLCEGVAPSRASGSFQRGPRSRDILTTMSESFVPGLPQVSVQGENWREVVNRQVEALRFGSVEITVHEGRVVQIETSTKVRFDKPR